MGSSLQDLAGALLIIFKTNSSVTGSKVSKGFPTKIPQLSTKHDLVPISSVHTWPFLTRIRRRKSPPGVSVYSVLTSA